MPSLAPTYNTSLNIPITRHGESHGNVEKSTYCSTPDHSVGLTDKGRQQAIATGQHLRRCGGGVVVGSSRADDACGRLNCVGGGRVDPQRWQRRHQQWQRRRQLWWMSEWMRSVGSGSGSCGE